MPKRRRKKQPVAEREPLTRPEQPNEVWSMDFVSNELACERKMNTLTVVDDYSKEAAPIAADNSIPARYVTRLLDEAIAKRSKPRTIRSENEVSVKANLRSKLSEAAETTTAPSSRVA